MTHLCMRCACGALAGCVCSVQRAFNVLRRTQPMADDGSTVVARQSVTRGWGVAPEL